MENQLLMPGDSTLIDNIVEHVKARGIFDEFRHECLADVDTKPSCQNLSQRVDGFTTKFLATITWHPDMNKNELRNKLRRHIDESGMLTIGADHVVEQVINPKIGQLFYPRIREIIPQYLSEENEKLNKRLHVTNEDVTEKATTDTSDGNSSKASKSVVLDPIADILAFSSSKTKPINQNVIHTKTENPVVKNPDGSKLEKKKDEKYSSQLLKSESLEKKKDDKIFQSIKVESTDKKKEEKISLKVEASEKKKDEISNTSVQIKSETVEKEEKCIQLSVKVEPLEKKKEEKIEFDMSESTVSAVPETKQSDDNSADKIDVSKQIKLEEFETEDLDNSKIIDSSTSTDETGNKSLNIAVPTKPGGIICKKSDKSDSNKSKQKFKISIKKPSSSTSEIQKLKATHKDSKPSEKHTKHSAKLIKTSKQLLAAIKGESSVKPSKDGEVNSKKKSNDSVSSKSVDASMKKSILKSSSMNKHISSKYKAVAEKSEKQKASKTDQHDPSTSGKHVKSFQYSSSYDSSQGSDQEKTVGLHKKERQKHFSKSVKKESCDKQAQLSSSGVSAEKHSKDNSDTKDSKKGKVEKLSKIGLLGKTTQEAGKSFSRSNSFGSTSSISSLSSVSKDVSTSEESAESPIKKLKRKVKESSKDKCHSSSKKFQPPPPPPPPSNVVLSSSSFRSTDEMQSSQSSQESKDSDSESVSDSSSDSEIEESTLCNQNLACSKFDESPSTSSTFMNDINDIFLYSSSSSEFEGFCSSPEKKKFGVDDYEDSGSVSSVHTSDLSSYDNELSVGDISSDESILDEIEGKKVTLEKAQEIIERKEKEQIAAVEKEKHEVEEEYKPPNNVRKSLHLFSEEDGSSPEPKRTLRRERKLNPKYASSEYTSIFTSKIKSFITKQDTDKESKSSKESTPSNAFSKPKEEDTSSKVKMAENSSVDLTNLSPKKSVIEGSEQCRPLRAKNCTSTSIKDLNMEKKSCKAKRKLDLDEASESPANKRPCSRSSIDSTSSEFASNENKPFNNEKKNSNAISSEKLNNIQKDFKETAVISENFKKDVPYKHKMNNNGDILNKIDPKKNSQSKILSNSEKKASEAETNLEVTTS